jgi:hypothetical protein
MSYRTQRPIYRGDIFYVEGRPNAAVPAVENVNAFLCHGARPAIIVSNDINNNNAKSHPRPSANRSSRSARRCSGISWGISRRTRSGRWTTALPCRSG